MKSTIHISNTIPAIQYQQYDISNTISAIHYQQYNTNRYNRKEEELNGK